MDAGGFNTVFVVLGVVVEGGESGRGKEFVEGDDGFVPVVADTDVIEATAVNIVEVFVSGSRSDVV